MCPQHLTLLALPWKQWATGKHRSGLGSGHHGMGWELGSSTAQRTTTIPSRPRQHRAQGSPACEGSPTKAEDMASRATLTTAKSCYFQQPSCECGLLGRRCLSELIGPHREPAPAPPKDRGMARAMAKVEVKDECRSSLRGTDPLQALQAGPSQMVALSTARRKERAVELAEAADP